MKSIRIFFTFTVLTLWFGCLGSNNTGTEIPNELTGMIVTKDGKPAANAKVTLYPVGYVPGDTDSTSALKFVTTTDSRGRYAVEQISVGKYNILSSKDDLLSYSDSISISENSTVLPTDTLDAAGTLTGKIQLQPQDDPQTATVQVLGTDKFVNVAIDGGFSLTHLAGGAYRLRVVTILPPYVPLYREVTVHSGKHDTLAQPLIPFFTGIPVVTGVKAFSDTVSGVVKITWKATSYSGFQSYLVYRDVAGALSFSKTPINKSRVTDTSYLDTLYRSPSDTLPLALEYRIRVQGVKGDSGDVYLPAVINVVPPRTAETAIQLSVLGSHGNSASINDTVRIVARFNNPAYVNTSLVWYLGGGLDTIRSLKMNLKTGADTLVWIAPDSEVTQKILVRLADEAGRNWKNSIQFVTLLDRPAAHAGNDTALAHGTTYTLRGRGTDGFGKIVKLEWDIGAKGIFATASTGDTNIVLPMAIDSSIVCILRVTDEDGLIGLDTAVLAISYPVTQLRRLNNVIWTGNQFVAVGDSGIILTSPDGILWSPQQSGTKIDLRSAVWTGKQFVITGEYYPYKVILTSPDGIAWITRGTGVEFGAGDKVNVGGKNIAWTGNLLIVNGDQVCMGCNGWIYTSPDGIAWDKRSAIYKPLLHYNSLTWTGNEAVFVGKNVVSTSPDGITWNGVDKTLPDLAYVTWAGNQLLAYGHGDKVDTVFISLDAVTWTSHVLSKPYIFKSVVWANGGYVAVCSNGIILTSPDAIAWVEQNSGTKKDLESIIWAESQFVVVGQGIILTSPDAIIWKQSM